jgi:hypothetical protein
MGCVGKVSLTVPSIHPSMVTQRQTLIDRDQVAVLQM